MIILKGGSLSTTFIQDDSAVVTKQINTTTNREYGFVRWQSQLKKTQFFNTLFPELIPAINKVHTRVNAASFDMEYLTGHQNIKQYLSSNPSQESILTFNNLLCNAFLTIHTNQNIPTINGLLELYFYEEVKQKLMDALGASEDFSYFVNLGNFTINGEPVEGLLSNELLTKTEVYFKNSTLKNESFILGNPTLENIMYNEQTHDIKFIDLYDESIINTNLIDYAQVLQCSLHHYCLINEAPIAIWGNNVSVYINVPTSFTEFNNVFKDTIMQPLSINDRRLVHILAATQFIRMLPFKCLAGDIDHAKYFYVLASKLLNDYLPKEEANNE